MFSSKLVIQILQVSIRFVLFLLLFLMFTFHLLGVALFFLLFSFGVSTIPLSYLLSYYFGKPSSGFVVMVVIYIITGLIANIAMSIVHTLSTLGDFFLMPESVLQLVLSILRLFPIFSFLFGYQKIYLLSQLSSICKLVPPEQICTENIKKNAPMLVGCCPELCEDRCYEVQNLFAISSFGCGTEVLFLFGVGITFFVLIILGEGKSILVYIIVQSHLFYLIVHSFPTSNT